MFVIHDMYDVCNNRDAVCFVSFRFKFFFRDIISHPAGAVLCVLISIVVASSRSGE